MKTARYLHTATVLGDSIFVCGGLNVSILNDCEVGIEIYKFKINKTIFRSTNHVATTG
jgi:hypothetical protein